MGDSVLQFSPVQEHLEKLHAQLLDIKDGEVASYIPELTRADPSWLGIAMATVDGHVYQVGDSRQQFTIQSISKAITYGLALEDRGLDEVLSKVGVEPSGEAFNSISLEPSTGRPLNPMINAGAIATTGMVGAKPGAPPMVRILETFARYTGHPVNIDEDVYKSESETGHRNRAIAHLLYGHGILDREPEEVLDLYFRQCSILVSARDLAMLAACLANNGVNPVTGVVALQSRYVEKVLSIMSTCGMYDYSGGWIFNVGMPAKSGVGGGIMAVLPGQFGIGVFSPALDPKGNSVRGIEACKRLSGDFSLHLFKVARSTSTTVVRQIYDCTEFTSRRRRSAEEAALIKQEGHRIQVYELQGELLFGGTESVTLDMLTRLARIDCLLIDLRRVTAMSEASMLILGELYQHAENHSKRLFFTDCKHLYRFSKHLRRFLGHARNSERVQFVDTDRALEWCEDRLLAERQSVMQTDAPVTDLRRQYLCADLSDEELAGLLEKGRERTFPAGTLIFRSGDPAESLFFIFSGEVEVTIDTDAGRRLRLTTLKPGMVFGEIALLNERLRTADVSAAQDTLCLEVRFDALLDPVRTRMLINMASYFARKIEQGTKVVQHLS